MSEPQRKRRRRNASATYSHSKSSTSSTSSASPSSNSKNPSTNSSNPSSSKDGAEHKKSKGNLFHCNYCQKDITNEIRIKCAKCKDFDLCVDCFFVGVETSSHKNDHDYRVIDASMQNPLFSSTWRGDEELLLIEGIEMYGLGNWSEVAEHVGDKSMAECEYHYWNVYIDTDAYPLPSAAKNKPIEQDPEKCDVEKDDTGMCLSILKKLGQEPQYFSGLSVTRTPNKTKNCVFMKKKEKDDLQTEIWAWKRQQVQEDAKTRKKNYVLTPNSEFPMETWFPSLNSKVCLKNFTKNSRNYFFRPFPLQNREVEVLELVEEEELELTQDFFVYLKTHDIVMKKLISLYPHAEDSSLLDYSKIDIKLASVLFDSILKKNKIIFNTIREKIGKKINLQQQIIVPDPNSDNTIAINIKDVTLNEIFPFPEANDPFYDLNSEENAEILNDEEENDDDIFCDNQSDAPDSKESSKVYFDLDKEKLKLRFGLDFENEQLICVIKNLTTQNKVVKTLFFLDFFLAFSEKISELKKLPLSVDELRYLEKLKKEEFSFLKHNFLTSERIFTFGNPSEMSPAITSSKIIKSPIISNFQLSLQRKFYYPFIDTGNYTQENLGAEVSYNKWRGDYDHEYDDKLEEFIQYLEMRDKEEEAEKIKKLRLLQVYERRLKERERRKAFALQQGIVRFKPIQNQERKWTKETKDLVTKYRKIARYFAENPYLDNVSKQTTTNPSNLQQNQTADVQNPQNPQLLPPQPTQETEADKKINFLFGEVTFPVEIEEYIEVSSKILDYQTNDKITLTFDDFTKGLTSQKAVKQEIDKNKSLRKMGICNKIQTSPQYEQIKVSKLKELATMQTSASGVIPAIVAPASGLTATVPIPIATPMTPSASAKNTIATRSATATPSVQLRTRSASSVANDDEEEDTEMSNPASNLDGNAQISGIQTAAPGDEITQLCNLVANFAIPQQILANSSSTTASGDGSFTPTTVQGPTTTTTTIEQNLLLDLNLLTKREKEMITELEIHPNQYLSIKFLVIAENLRLGFLSPQAAIALLTVATPANKANQQSNSNVFGVFADNEEWKIMKLYEFFAICGWIQIAKPASKK